MRRLIIASSILAPVVASSSAAFAGGYLIPNESPRELAMAQSAEANQTGADALFMNTAALAGQEGLDISLGAELLVNRTDWSDPSLGSASLKTKANTPPTATVSYGRHMSNGMAGGAGVGVNVPAGGGLNWPTAWPGQEYVQSVSQQVFAIGAGAAFQPTPFLKLGVGYLRFQATEELHQSINYLDHYGDAGIVASGGANGVMGAIELDVPKIPLVLAVTYVHSGDLNMSGDAHFTQVPTAFQPLLHDQGVSEDLIIPDVLYVGAAYEVIPNLKVSAAYDFERWSPYKEDKFVGSGGFSVTVPRDYKNAYVVRVGAEWANTPFLPALTLRVGGLRSISPQPTETLAPSLTDGDSTAFCLGAGYNVKSNLRIDLGWQHAILDSVTAKMGSDAFPGTYKTTVDFVSLGINWRSDLGMTR
jgi:long-subunit fatty acid transport protein